MDKYDFFAWYVKCIQEKFIAGYREKPAMENAYFGSLTGELLVKSKFVCKLIFS